MNHHPTDALLLAYSAGTLPEAFSLVLATHLTLCLDCRAQALAFDAVGGALLGSQEATPLAADALANTLARLSGPLPETAAAPATDLPAPLADYVGGSLAAVKWRSIGMGVRQSILPTAAGASARLLYIPAGVAVPDHGHRGMELTLVLQGAFRDQTDRFGPGDLEVADEALNHTPVAEPGGPCICLAATDAPLRFTRLIPRLAQSLFRI